MECFPILLKRPFEKVYKWKRGVNPMDQSKMWNPSSFSNRFAESATLELAAKAKALAASGKPVINFSVGEPDFNTPSPIIEAAHAAALRGETKYTAVGGTPQAKAAVAKRLSEDYGVSFDPQEVVLSTGGKQSIFHFLQATLEPGDEVIIPSPYWTSFPEMVKMVGGTPVIVAGENGRLRAETLKKAITPRTRMLIFNSPSNPHGLVYSKEEIESFLAVIEPHPIWLLSDDTYYSLVYEGEFHSALRLRPGFRNRTAVVGSLSKSYAMTGWRLGWVVAPRPMAQAITKIQGQVTSGPNSLSQAATVEALGASHATAGEFRNRFLERRDFLLAQLREKLPQLSYMPPQGAFYCFLKMSDLLRGGSVTTFCEKLLQEQFVCLVPGEAFGEPEYARLSYALSEKSIAEGLDRIQKCLS
jgi:aspartate aminotransferase